MSVPGLRQVLVPAKVSRTFGRGATAVSALRDVGLTVSAGEFVATTERPENPFTASAAPLAA